MIRPTGPGRTPERHSRRDPPWWDHQRLPLIALRQGVEQALDRFAPAGNGRTVLDFGCGDKPYEPLVRARGFDYVAADISGDPDILIEPGIRIDRADASCAGVVSFQVLEHVWDINWYLSECRRLIEPGGWLLLSTHGVWPYHPHPTDYRRWTGEGLRRELELQRFEVLMIRGLLGPLAWTTQVRALGFRHVMLQLPLLRAFVPLVMAAMNSRMKLEELVTPDTIRQENACIYVVFCKRSEARIAPDSAE